MMKSRSHNNLAHGPGGMKESHVVNQVKNYKGQVPDTGDRILPEATAGRTFGSITHKF